MSFEFSADEIFAMAERIEKNGEQFYRNSARQVKDTEARSLLTKLADMEIEHLKIFSSLKSKLSAAGKAKIEDIIKEEMRHIRLLGERLAALKK